MKILFLCRFLPHQKARDSGRQDTYHYISSLSEGHEVSLIAFVSEKDRRHSGEVEAMCRRAIFIPYSHSRLPGRLWRAFWRLLMSRVYGRNLSFSYLRQLQKLLAQESFDVFFVDGQMAAYMRWLQDGKKVLDEVDIYADVAGNYYRRQRTPVQRAFAYLDWRRTSSAEHGYISEADGVLVRSSKDEDLLKQRFPGAEIAVLPPWFEGLEELKDLPEERPEGNTILFVGAMDIPANQEAAAFFATEVFPRVKDIIPDAEFLIVGSSPDRRTLLLDAEDGVTVTGEVEDLRQYYEKAAVNVVPLLTGGGIIVKTLNGLASGRPTVATEAGFAGTGAREGQDILVVQAKAEEFSDAVCRILEDRVLWQRLSRNGRDYIHRTYDWEQIIGDLEAFFMRLTRSGA